MLVNGMFVDNGRTYCCRMSLYFEESNFPLTLHKEAIGVDDEMEPQTITLVLDSLSEPKSNEIVPLASYL
jgi:hypothetical protein